MKILLKDNRIVLSDVPTSDVERAILIFDKSGNPVTTDVKKGMTEYTLPKGKTDKDVDAIYLRVV